jgi:hypothetical protein
LFDSNYLPQVGHDPGVGAKLTVLLLSDSKPNDLIILLSLSGVAPSRALTISKICFFSAGLSAMNALTKFSIFELIYATLLLD